MVDFLMPRHSTLFAATLTLTIQTKSLCLREKASPATKVLTGVADENE
jgi:hypothetical protein